MDWTQIVSAGGWLGGAAAVLKVAVDRWPSRATRRDWRDKEIKDLTDRLDVKDTQVTDLTHRLETVERDYRDALVRLAQAIIERDNAQSALNLLQGMAQATIQKGTGHP